MECPHCTSDHVEVVLESKVHRDFYCWNCGKTFHVEKTPEEQAEWIAELED